MYGTLEYWYRDDFSVERARSAGLNRDVESSFTPGPGVLEANWGYDLMRQIAMRYTPESPGLIADKLKFSRGTIKFPLASRAKTIQSKTTCMLSEQVKRLWRVAKKLSLEVAAEKAGMDSKTAREYLRDRRRLPGRQRSA